MALDLADAMMLTIPQIFFFFFPLPLSLSLCLIGDLYFHLKQYSNVVSKHGQWPNISLYGYIMDKVSTNTEAESDPGPSDSNLTTAPSPSPADCH